MAKNIKELVTEHAELTAYKEHAEIAVDNAIYYNGRLQALINHLVDLNYRGELTQNMLNDRLLKALNYIESINHTLV